MAGTQSSSSPPDAGRPDAGRIVLRVLGIAVGAYAASAALVAGAVALLILAGVDKQGRLHGLQHPGLRGLCRPRAVGCRRASPVRAVRRAWGDNRARWRARRPSRFPRPDVTWARRSGSR